MLIYEMLLGKAPFAGESEDRIFNAILRDVPSIPATTPQPAVDIILKVSAQYSF